MSQQGPPMYIEPSEQFVQSLHNKWCIQLVSFHDIIREAVAWGQDQELHAVKLTIISKKWFADPYFRLDELHRARRTGGSTPQQRALDALRVLEESENIDPALVRTIRQGLEQNNQSSN